MKTKILTFVILSLGLLTSCGQTVKNSDIVKEDKVKSHIANSKTIAKGGEIKEKINIDSKQSITTGNSVLDKIEVGEKGESIKQKIDEL